MDKNDIKVAMRSIVRLRNAKVYGDKSQVEFWNHTDSVGYSDEWKEIYEQHQRRG